MKIQKITIDKYKAFTKEEIIPVGGKNVFVYGENGSGKSSFYYALKDFFQSSVENVEMDELRNYNLNDGGSDCSIKVEFDGEIIKTLNDRAKDTNTTEIIDANRLKSFLTYKHLLGVHNIKISEKIDVFDLVVNGVLKHFKSKTITENIELATLWNDVKIEQEKKYGRGMEFYFVRQKKDSVERKARKVNKALDNLFISTGADYLAPFVNDVLVKLYPEMKVEFIRRNISINSYGRISQYPQIILQVFEKGVSIDAFNPSFALNEAKLSAIAISIFLGSILKLKSIFSPEINPLFLDDILIGLDNENRLKLLHLLLETDVPDENKVFKDFQIFLTTYDRHWYEVAKINLPGWKFIEFYKSEKGPQILHSLKTPIEKARVFFEAYDFPASSNYLRKECERVLKDKLLKTYIVDEGIKGLVKPPSLEMLIDRLRIYYEDLGIDPPTSLIDNLQIYKSLLLNPMSHSDLESPIYRNDLEMAFQVIEELGKLELPKRELLLEKGKPFSINLPAISYQGEVEIADNVYKVENGGSKTISPVNFLIKAWTREGVPHASPTGSPPTEITALDRLNNIKENPASIAKLLTGLNMTFTNLGVPNITEEDLLKSLEVSGGQVLFDILEDAKK